MCINITELNRVRGTIRRDGDERCVVPVRSVHFKAQFVHIVARHKVGFRQIVLQRECLAALRESGAAKGRGDAHATNQVARASVHRSNHFNRIEYLNTRLRIDFRRQNRGQNERKPNHCREGVEKLNFRRNALRQLVSAVIA